MTAEAPQRDPSLREGCKGRRWLVRAGAAWRLMPPDLPPWPTVYQPSHRGLKAGVFPAMVQALRAGLRLAPGRTARGRYCCEAAAALDARKRHPCRV
jgi:transposase